MPGSDTPIAGLGHQLASVLLLTLLWAALAVAVVAVAAWALDRSGSALPTRVRLLVTGPDVRAEGPEPAGRRFLRIAFGLLWLVDGLLQAQPLMAGAFPSQVIGGDIGPGWYMSWQSLLARAWARHPVAADAATVWVQVGLGLALLFAVRGRPARLAAVASVVWAAIVWFSGESVGGLLAAGAGWLTGAPGAVLVYAVAGAVLLMPWSSWRCGERRSGAAPLVLRRATAVWLAVSAVLQALPGEQFWHPDMLSAPFADGAGTNPSALLRSPISRLETLAVDSPHALNLAVIIVLAVLAVALWAGGSTPTISAVVVWCLATWWLAQDFGVLGGTATDPNTALPLALLVAAALPVWVPAGEPAAGSPPPAPEPTPTRTPGWRLGAGAAALAFGLASIVVVPGVLAAGLARPADATAIAADSDGGLQSVPLRAAPPWTLRDQTGRTVSLRSLHGRLVVLTFLDPVCTSDCPLIANQLAVADRSLGSLARRVQIVAVDSNPIFRSRADVAAFTASHGLGGLPNWHFLWGRGRTALDVLARYGVSVDVPAVGMVQHSEAVYFIRPDGLESGYLDDGAAAQLTTTYAQRIEAEIRTLLA